MLLAREEMEGVGFHVPSLFNSLILRVVLTLGVTQPFWTAQCNCIVKMCIAVVQRPRVQWIRDVEKWVVTNRLIYSQFFRVSSIAG